MSSVATGLVTGLLLAPLALGCGYHVLGAPGPEGERPRVAIATLDNDSRDSGVELLVTNAMRRSFVGSRDFRLVEDSAEADLRLGGSVRAIDTSAKSFSSVVLALEYTVTLRLDLEVDRREGGALELDQAAFSESELYLASADVEATRKNRREALRRLADLLSERVRDALQLELARVDAVPEPVPGAEAAAPAEAGP